MQGSRRRSSSGSVEPELLDMLSSSPGDLLLLPRPPLEAAVPSWSFDFASSSSSSTQIGRFPRPLAALFDEILPSSIDLQAGLHQQHDVAGRPQNEQEEGGYLAEMEERMCCDGFSLREHGTDSSLSYSHLQDLQLQPSRSVTDLEFQDGASLNRSRGFLDEDSNTTPWPPLTPPNSDDSCITGFSKKPKLSELAGSPVEVKPQISQSQVKKLGERITALQQLVSPFGKTDTASVLLEAIEYIKFLQDQVQVLSSPYMMPTVSQKISGKLLTKSQGAEVGTDLRSRGLCLVPISCTPEVANSNGADYWASGISGRSRC